MGLIKAVTHEPVSDALLNELVAGNMMAPPNARLAAAVRELDNDGVLSQLTVPVRVMHGAHDVVVVPKAGEDVVKIAPNTPMITYENSGHAPFLEEADKFNADLAAFLKSVN